MEFKEVLEQLEQFKDSQEYKDYIGGLNPITSDRVNEYLQQTDEGKKVLQPILDKYHGKSLESWKANNLQKLIDEEITKRFPESDPKDIELANMKAQLEALQKETLKKDLKNTALKVANEKKLPIDLIDYFISDNEESTLNNLKMLEKVYNEAVSKTVDERLGKNHIPDDSGNIDPDDGITLAFKQLNPGIKL